ncbi:hypothetical protein [Streptococcus equi]|uniref:hypothetical protein n=1 Tax=Streptococcus equi TaxID=1336 RepID=UPI0005B7D821|nr:hypothetical protein [Streptococcus equi]KIS06495.1 hypothetical protein AT53_00147 [Streptococcus equi subsp. zooepidemicus Sz5]MDI5918894.1 hypothetical protein [Streptococcus equi subsp. zooepidemicus]MDI5951818.1 hypothetical protein [Streptococcus equi subsp. zooepidemicus]MDI5956991.1 hypothetical protein [Streptococcus equi subsp. zooepidemicus]MDI6074011.1 hypothetical protein [Streptococcus equi subsp. zooepidemicus]
MKLLHKESIRTCSELDEAIHQAEVERLTERLLTLPNYDCEMIVTFEDDYHKAMNFPLFYESNLHRLFEFLEERDIKNGVDSFLTDTGDLAFRAYGQNYTHQGKDGILTSLVTVKCFSEGRVPVNMTRILGGFVMEDLTKGKEGVICDSI